MATVTCIFYAINDVKNDERLYTDRKINLMAINITCFEIKSYI